MVIHLVLPETNGRPAPPSYGITRRTPGSTFTAKTGEISVCSISEASEYVTQKLALISFCRYDPMQISRIATQTRNADYLTVHLGGGHRYDHALQGNEPISPDCNGIPKSWARDSIPLSGQPGTLDSRRMRLEFEVVIQGTNIRDPVPALESRLNQPIGQCRILR